MTTILDSTLCPLCGNSNKDLSKSNENSTCTGDDKCWCMNLKVPQALLDRIPEHLRRQACICKTCVDHYYAEKADSLTVKAQK